jgi:hypothetical protein
MNAQTHDAYLAIIDEAEARLAVAEGTRVLAVGLAEIAEARITALEATVRDAYAVTQDRGVDAEQRLAMLVMILDWAITGTLDRPGLDAAEDRAAKMQTSLDLCLTDLQALRAAARAIVAGCRVPRGAYLGDACRWCDNTIDRDGHRPGCPVGVLLPLVEEGAP